MIHFDIKGLEAELQTLEAETAKQGFWEDSKNSNIVLSKIKRIKGRNQYQPIKNSQNNLIIVLIFQNLILKQKELLDSNKSYVWSFYVYLIKFVKNIL